MGVIMLQLWINSPANELAASSALSEGGRRLKWTSMGRSQRPEGEGAGVSDPLQRRMKHMMGCIENMLL